jgi:UDP-glucuronate 4-epimerase
VTALVSGTAGFIGYHVAEALLARGDDVIGIDNINDYYDVRLKQARLARLEDKPGFRFRRADIADRDVIHDLVRKEPGIDVIVHLAAQAGVRYSLVDPYAYVHSNVMGHLVMLEAARLAPRLRHFVYASSSSVYGANSTLPFSETDRVETPLSMYAATKLADEMMSHAYGHLHALPQTGLRFFTVYGPWGRPDMAYYSFARAIMAGEPITLYEGGTLRRDFTYIDDIVAGVVGCLDHPPDRTPPARVLNIGNHRSELVSTLVELLETSLGRRAVIREVPRPLSDVPETFASVAAISALTGFAPRTTLAEGIPRFVAWFKAWNGHPQEV